jgi:hypothetical protein
MKGFLGLSRIHRDCIFKKRTPAINSLIYPSVLSKKTESQKINRD